MDPLSDFEDLTYRYTVGIDLGTTNSAVAYVDRAGKDAERRLIRFLEIPQLTAPGEVGRRPILPSFLYLPGTYELPEGSTALPWDPKRAYVVGELAREQGALVPGRLVASAKSWLCHGGVDRTAAILPWGAGTKVDKVPPVEASAYFLQHIREVWNKVMAHGREGYLLEEQMIVLTVPASFDEVARELTVTAAHQAGLPRVVLVEEPLAAFYSWLARHETDWQAAMHAGQLILVCDVGGGTTDFTIVAVREGEKGLRFDRLAVGEHLMLGGDNMDLALARNIEMQLLGRPGQLDSKRWHQLWHQCRKAKETLLAEGGTPDQAVDITVTGSGGKLIADTLKSRLTLQDVEKIIIEGFFPAVSRQEVPAGTRRTGLTEWGLPYVQDPAITRHMAAFWQRFATLLQQETGRSALYPDFILFNGGALAPKSIRQRILEVVRGWFRDEAGPEWMPMELGNPRPELAVAMGAAYYGMVRLGEGVRVGAGSPRAYYVEVAAEAKPAQEEPQHTALCVVARGTEEGFTTQLSQPAFQVLANQPVAFQLFSSSTRLGDQLGDLVTLADEEVTALPPIRTVLRFGKKGSAQSLPVQLAVHLTEIGTLELWCESQQTPHRWQLQFDVRQQAEAEAENGTVAGETLEAELIEQALQKIRDVFQGPATNPDAPQRLMKELIASLDLSKEKWPTPLIRKTADALLECKAGRTLTPQHEARWFNLLGYCLRPGFGDPVDEWRMREIWKIFPQGVHFHRQVQGRSEWWIFWRRVAGGLTAGQQWHIYQQLTPVFQPVPKKKKKGGKKSVKSVSVQEELEIWMMLANFERLPAANKVEIGQLILDKITKSKPKPQELWAVGRLGARIPFYGPLDQVIPAAAASSWLKQLLHSDLEASDALAQSLVQLARRTGDRERDLPVEDRDRLAAWLAPLPQGKRLCEVLTNPETTLGDREQDWIFGEALPTGLVMVEDNP